MSHTTSAMMAAQATAENYLDEIVGMLLDKGKASNDLLNDYPDGDAYHHDNHVDISYSLSEAADLLEELHAHEETDYGLWDGQEPRVAVCSQAVYTYGNAVMHYFQNLIGHINDQFDEDEEMAVLLEAYNGDSPEGDDVDKDGIRKVIKALIECWVSEYV